MESWDEHTKILKNSEHFKKLWQNGRVAVLDSRSNGSSSSNIQRHLNEVGVANESLDADNPGWYKDSCDRGCTHYLFLSQPESLISRSMSRRAEMTSEEYTFFKDCSITKAVLVVENFPPKKKGDVLAERFLKLERHGHDDEWLATAALIMFSRTLIRAQRGARATAENCHTWFCRT